MTTLREAAQQALDALIQCREDWENDKSRWHSKSTSAMCALKTALAQPESEPAIKQNITIAELTFGGRCEKHLQAKPCGMCATGFDMGHMIGPIFHTPTQTKSEPSDRAQQVAVPQEHLSSLDDVIFALRKLELTYGVYNDSKNLKTVRDFLEMLKAAPQPPQGDKS